MTVAKLCRNKPSKEGLEQRRCEVAKPLDGAGNWLSGMA
jgi:hypothetical protein